MTSVVGGEPIDMTPQAIADPWAKGLRPVKAVRHQVGNMVTEVDGNGADVHCHGTATHFKPGEVKRVTSFVGTYDLHLSRIRGRRRIDRFRSNAKYVERRKACGQARNGIGGIE